MKMYILLIFFFVTLVIGCQAPTQPIDPLAYSLTYLGNGNTSGKVPVDSHRYAKGEQALVQDNLGSLQKTGYKFAGWNTKSDCSGLTMTPGLRGVFEDSDVQLTAIWIPETYVFSNYGTDLELVSILDSNELEELTIPEGVTKIDTEFCQDVPTLRSVSFPSTIHQVQYSRAFWGCSSLEAFHIDSRHPYYKDVGGVVFSKDQTELILAPPGLSGTYQVPQSVTTLSIAAFAECTVLERVVLPTDLEKIGSECFRDCHSLADIEIPSKVETIEGMTFWGCKNLISIKFSEGLRSICSQAFAGCSDLSELYIPSTVSSIEPTAFEDCPQMASFLASSLNTSYKSVAGSLYTKNLSELVLVPRAYDGEFSIPDSVKNIGNYAFYQVQKLSSVSIPVGVSRIGWSAFESCRNLLVVVLPSSVSIVDGNAFRGCDNLAKVIVNTSVPPQISDSWDIFSDCPRLAEILVPLDALEAYTTGNWGSHWAAFLSSE